MSGDEFFIIKLYYDGDMLIYVYFCDYDVISLLKINSISDDFYEV